MDDMPSNRSRKPPNVATPRFEVEELEPRLLFSAEAAVLLTGDVPPAIERTMASDTQQSPQASPGSSLQAHEGGQQVRTLAQELVLIDASVDDIDLLLADLEQQRQAGRSIEVIVLQSDRDGIQQISEALSQRQDLQAIHLVTHGDQQGLQIGSTRLDQASLLAHAGLISQWGAALSDAADLMLYGCDLAGSADGLQLIDQLGQLTGADVAASDDLTGALTHGGDWDLEHRSGQIESALAFSNAAQQNWQQVLATATFQEGVNGYTGTQDTLLHPSSPAADYGASTTLTLDDDVNTQILIRFDNLFGNGPGQIPYGSTITSASLLVYVVTADASETVDLYQVLTNWTEASTWNSLSSGLSTNGVEASSSPLATIGNTGSSGAQTLSGLASIVQSWLDGGTTNNGFMLQGVDAVWGIATSEHGTASYRPQLSVTYTLPASPVVGNLGGDSLNYNEGSGAVVIDQGTAATLTDSDTTVFNTGTLTVSIPAGGSSSQDALGIRHQGTAAGQIGVSGSNVTYGGTTIGTVTGGTGGANLVVTLNGSATTAAVQALIRNITYANTDTDNPTAGARTVRFSLYDGAGGTSTHQDVTLTVVAANDAPTATITPNTYSATEQVTLNLHGTGLSIADPDANSASLVATLSVLSGTLSVAAGSSGVAVSGSGSSSVTLTGTLAQINSLLAGNGGATVTFVHSSDAPPASTTLTLGVDDQGNTGSGSALTGSDTATINITGANDAPTGSVSISGTAAQGQTLTASNTLADADGMGTVTYQWLRNGVAVSGATSSTYGLTQADVGTVITVRASYTDGYGTAESSTSAATASVANINDAPTGSVTISGTATQGQTLTAGNTLADADGMGTVTYQWLRDGVAISGATSGTYLLTQADVGTAISVRGSYTDGYGAAESSTSAATASVANINDAPTGSVTISGTATQGQTLTAGDTLADADGMGTVSYQWL
ncbi:MAG: DUF4347 domain-containing protein, partial [Rubrivivax sp.]